MTDDAAKMVERLREAHRNSQQYALGSPIFSDAADLIERLERERDEARDSLNHELAWHNNIVKINQEIIAEKGKLFADRDSLRAQLAECEKKLGNRASGEGV